VHIFSSLSIAPSALSREGDHTQRRGSRSYAQLLTTSYLFGKFALITGSAFRAQKGDGIGGKWTLASPSLPVCIGNCAGRVAEVRLPGGFCVVVSTVACLDVLSDFVALRRRLGAEGAAARQRCSVGIAGSRG
jgi:hypothetical protein